MRDYAIFQKIKESDELKKKMDAFLARGGQIKVEPITARTNVVLTKVDKSLINSMRKGDGEIAL